MYQWYTTDTRSGANHAMQRVKDMNLGTSMGDKRFRGLFRLFLRSPLITRSLPSAHDIHLHRTLQSYVRNTSTVTLVPDSMTSPQVLSSTSLLFVRLHQQSQQPAPTNRPVPAFTTPACTPSASNPPPCPHPPSSSLSTSPPPPPSHAPANAPSRLASPAKEAITTSSSAGTPSEHPAVSPARRTAWTHKALWPWTLGAGAVMRSGWKRSVVGPLSCLKPS